MEKAFYAMLTFLVSTAFSFYLFLVMLRFLLQWVKADFYNPLCQFVIRMTNPLLIPLRRIVPGFLGLDCAAIVLMVMLELIETFILFWLAPPMITLNPWLIAALIAIRLISILINVMFFAIIIRALSSWLNHDPTRAHPFLEALFQLTEPVLSRARRWIKPIAGVDLSPVLVLILLELINIFLNNLI